MAVSPISPAAHWNVTYVSTGDLHFYNAISTSNARDTDLTSRRRALENARIGGQMGRRAKGLSAKQHDEEKEM